MSINLFEVEYNEEFEKEVDRFVVKKRFRHLPEQIEELVKEIESGNLSGTPMSKRSLPVPHDIYKLRLPNLDTNAGKSNGYRVIYMALTENKVVVLLTIYYKKEQTTISDDYITALIDGYFLNQLEEE